MFMLSMKKEKFYHKPGLLLLKFNWAGDATQSRSWTFYEDVKVICFGFYRICERKQAEIYCFLR